MPTSVACNCGDEGGNIRRRFLFIFAERERERDKERKRRDYYDV
jgi:hypothetical protein